MRIIMGEDEEIIIEIVLQTLEPYPLSHLFNNIFIGSKFSTFELQKCLSICQLFEHQKGFPAEALSVDAINFSGQEEVGSLLLLLIPDMTSSLFILMTNVAIP